jgi:hypothetical protein
MLAKMNTNQAERQAEIKANQEAVKLSSPGWKYIKRRAVCLCCKIVSVTMVML